MVLAVAVHVEDHVPAGTGDRIDDRDVTPLADVDDALDDRFTGGAATHHARRPDLRAVQTETVRPTRRRRRIRRRSRSDLPPHTP